MGFIDEDKAIKRQQEEQANRYKIKIPVVDTEYNNVYMNTDLRKLASSINSDYGGDLEQAVSIVGNQNIPISKNVSGSLFGSHQLGTDPRYNYGGSVQAKALDDLILSANINTHGGLGRDGHYGKQGQSVGLGAKYNNDIVNAEVARDIINNRNKNRVVSDSGKLSVNVPDTPIRLVADAYDSRSENGNQRGKKFAAEYVNDGLTVGLGSSKDKGRNRGKPEYSMYFNKKF